MNKINIDAWKCGFCGKIFISHKECDEHETSCPFDYKHKQCQTCKFFCADGRCKYPHSRDHVEFVPLMGCPGWQGKSELVYLKEIFIDWIKKVKLILDAEDDYCSMQIQKEINGSFIELSYFKSSIALHEPKYRIEIITNDEKVIKTQMSTDFEIVWKELTERYLNEKTM